VQNPKLQLMSDDSTSEPETRTPSSARKSACAVLAVLTLLAGLGLCVLLIPPSGEELRASKPYQDGFAWALANPKVRESLGEPIVSELVAGGLREFPGMQKHAVLSGLLRGPKDTGVLEIHATGVEDESAGNDEWAYLEVVVRLQDGTVIDLQSEEQEDAPTPSSH